MVLLLLVFFHLLGTDACTRSRAIVRITCPSNKELSTTDPSKPVQVTWQRSEFKVTSTHPIKGIFQTIPEYGAGASHTHTFHEGTHKVQYKAVDQSGNFDSCSFYVTVKVNRCNRLADPASGLVTCSEPHPDIVGATCNFTCTAGFSLVGTPFLTCLKDGRWSASAPFCKVLTCPDPGTPFYGTRVCAPPYVYTDACTFGCEAGYKLDGPSQIFCVQREGRPVWSHKAPFCRRIAPPQVELCPANMEVSTNRVFTELPEPQVRFRTSQGRLAPHHCDPFGPSRRHNFTVGIHTIRCRGYDPLFGTQTTSSCVFTIYVKANPCRPLPQPQNGFLLCSRAQGGHVRHHDTTCQLFCYQGYALPRVDTPVSMHHEFRCNQSGRWEPTEKVPGCVVPKRPHELQLETEIHFYAGNCRNLSISNYIRRTFKETLQEKLRMQRPCKQRATDCIVEVTQAQFLDHDLRPRRHTRHRHRHGHGRNGRRRPGRLRIVRGRYRPRRKRHISDWEHFQSVYTDRTEGTEPSSRHTRDVIGWSGYVADNVHSVNSHLESQQGDKSLHSRTTASRTSELRITRDHVHVTGSDRDQYGISLAASQSIARGQFGTPLIRDKVTVSRRRRSVEDCIISIKFQFATRLHRVHGQWPDEFHKAKNRLYTMFDYFEFNLNEVSRAYKNIHQALQLKVRPDSLTFAPVKVKCPFPYVFNRDIAMCVTCGAGFYYNTSVEQCVACPLGYYEDREGQFECRRCPPGTASIETGASRLKHCVDIDECLSSPCQNGGRCNNGDSRYSCVCLPGFTGVHCETPEYDCTHHGCQNGGRCQPDGVNNYTCSCPEKFSGIRCQLPSVDGGWTSWGEWSTCSRSCEGGVRLRNRTCAHPVPSFGGKSCEGESSQKEQCNLQICPKCKVLRRPYQGMINCTENRTRDLITCTVSCPQGYGFTGFVFKEYRCGRSTNYLWPHESPDNPRCTLPACMPLTEASQSKFYFQANFSINCDSPEREAEISRQVAKRATQLTANLDCLRQGTCSLAQPRISGCENRRKRSPQGSRPSSISVQVALLYHGGPRHATGPLHRIRRKRSTDGVPVPTHQTTESADYTRTSNQIWRLGSRLLRKASHGHLYLQLGKRRVAADRSATDVVSQLVCPHGMKQAFRQTYCVECSPGSHYHGRLRDCSLCEVGTYQPSARQVSCLACPSGYRTPGRGATSPQDCFDPNALSTVIPTKTSQEKRQELSKKLLGLLRKFGQAAAGMSQRRRKYKMSKQKVTSGSSSGVYRINVGDSV